MRFCPTWVALSCAYFTACSLNLRIPADAKVTCSDDAQCPTQQRCSPTLQRCVPAQANQVPSVTIAPIARSLSVTNVAIRLVDAEADPTSLAIFVIVDGQRIDARPFVATPLDQVPASPDGTSQDFALDLSSLLSGNRYRAELRVAITPRDETGVGAEVTSEPFEFGNDAPVVSDVVVYGNAGTLRIAFSVRDSSADPVEVIGLQHTSLPNTAPQTIDLEAPHILDPTQLTGIASLGGQTELQWVTAASGAHKTDSVTLALRVRDAFGAESELVSAAAVLLDNSPTLTLARQTPTARPLQTLDFAADLFDPSLPSIESLTLDFKYIVGPIDTIATRHPLLVGEPTSGIQSNGPRAFVWDALAEAQAARLPLRALDTSNGLQAPIAALGYVSELTLEAFAENTAGLRSKVVQLALGPVGNDAPVATISAVGDGVGEIPISVSIIDSSFDPADLEVEFRVGPSGPFRTAALKLSNVSDLATSPTGTTHLALWNSTIASDPDPLTPQGIGATRGNLVELRVRAIDRAGAVSAAGGTAYYGEWFTAPPVTINNQSPPRVDAVQFDRLITSDGSAPVVIRYRVIDAESDPVDVRFEVSFDGAPFESLPPFPHELAEGTTRLSSAPDDGVEHVFVWNPTADRLSSHVTVSLRMTARDLRDPEDTVQERLLPRPVQHSFAAPNDVRYADVASVNTSGNIGEIIGLITTGDVSGDGITDIVTVESTGPTAQVHLGQGSSGQGDGTFALTGNQWHCSDNTAPVSCSGVGFAAAKLVDATADGVLDLVFANTDGTVSIQLGTGSDCLAAQSCFVIPAEAYTLSGVSTGLVGIEVDNFDGTAGSELVILGADGALSAYALSPTGSPAPSVSLSLITSVNVATDALNLLAADVDFDGDRDFVVLSQADLVVAVVLNQLSDVVPSLQLVATVDVPPGLFLVSSAVFELDGNALPDLAVLASNELITYVGVGAPDYFVKLDSRPSPRVAGYFTSADINDDGIDDLVVTEQDITSTFRSVSGFLGRGRSLSQADPLTRGLDRAPGATTADLNGDELTDVVYLKDDQVNFNTPYELYSLSTTKTLQNNAQLPHLSEPVLENIADYTSSTELISMRAVDMDADGIWDLVISHMPSGFLIKRGLGSSGFGSGAFAPGYLLQEADSVAGWEAHDVNSDGRSDLIYLRAGSGGYDLVVATTNADRSLTLNVLATIPTNPNKLWLVDINSDDIKDILLGRPGTAGILVFLGNGINGVPDGTFTAGTTVTTPAPGVGTLVSGDFDGDRVTDLIYARISGFGANTTYFAKGNGDGTFAASTAVAGVTLAGYAHTVDWNHDGALDLVSSGQLNFFNDAPVITRLGRLDPGTGRADATFEAGVTQPGIAGVVTPGPVHLVDFDQDGHLDLLAFTRARAKVLLMRGNTSGGFDPAVTLFDSDGFEPHAFVARDFNSDGMADWAITHFASPLLTTFFGQHQAHQSFTQAVRVRAGTKVQAYGPNVVEPDLGMSGLAVDQLGSKTVELSPVRMPSWSTHFDFWDAIVHAPTAAGLQVHRTRPITNPFSLNGFTAPHRQPPLVADGLGDRLFLFNKFGPLLGSDPFSRAGLSLADNRGLIVRLPLVAGLTHQQVVTAVNEGRVRVYRYQRTLLRSDEVTEDPLDDHAYLPRIAGPTGGYDLIRYRTAWDTLPLDVDGFASGSGERFTVTLKPLGARTNDPNDRAKGNVELLVDQPGMVQAFEVDVP